MRGRAGWRWVDRHETVLLGVMILAGTIITAVNPGFLTVGNAVDLVNSTCFLAILAVGVFLVLVAGGIDISFTATAATAQYVTAVMLVQFGGNWLVAWLWASGVGLGLGLINALLVHALRIPSIITTIATLNLYQGLLTGLSGGRWIYELPPWFRRLGEWKFLAVRGEAGGEIGLSVGALVLVGVVVLTGVLRRWTLPGRSLYALGGSETGARRLGLNLLGMRLFMFGYLGLLAGWAGLVNTLQVQVASPGAIVGRELDVFAAVVLGGVGIQGGSGTLLGTLLGVALVAMLSNGLTLMRVPPVWDRLAIGLVLVSSVTVAAWRQRAGRGNRSFEEATS